MVIALFAAVWAHWIQKISMRRSGQKLRNELDAAFSAGHEFVSVAATDFGHLLDLGFYAQKQHELELEGFRWVDDVEDLTLSKLFPTNRTFQRLLVTPDGKMRATIYHFRPTGLLARAYAFFKLIPSDVYSVELSTEFSGAFTLSTNTMKNFTTLDMPPELDILSVEAETPTAELVHLHLQRVERHLEQNPQDGFHPATSRDELLAAAQRTLLLCEKFRKREGYSLEELTRVSGRAGSKSGLKQLHEAINEEPSSG